MISVAIFGLIISEKRACLQAAVVSRATGKGFVRMRYVSVGPAAY